MIIETDSCSQLVITDAPSQEGNVVVNAIYLHEYKSEDSSWVWRYKGGVIHNEDTATFPFKKDGHYEVYHYELTDFDHSEEKDYYYKKVNNEFKIYKKGLTGEMSIETFFNEPLIRMEMTKDETFVVYYLRKCYIEHCKKIFNLKCDKCSQSKVDTFARDFIWMILNVIKYYIDFHQISEAERLLQEMSDCNGFCNETTINKIAKTGCGCGS